ncbi:MAG: nickel-type superoxide dismutase maturation protease [Colwellia sp.]
MFCFKLWKVRGQSMTPVIHEGSFILVTKLLLLFPVKEGQRILIKHPEYGIIVKTVALVDKNGFIWSKGENKKSLSVEQIGPVDKEQVLGRIIGIFEPTSV